MNVTRFDAHMVGPQFGCHDRTWFDTEDEALAFARAQVGPNQDQVTVTAHTDDHAQTFAMRHLLWEDGAARDSGWRIWRRGKFIGGGELADITKGDK